MGVVLRVVSWWAWSQAGPGRGGVYGRRSVGRGRRWSGKLGSSGGAGPQSGYCELGCIFPRPPAGERRRAPNRPARPLPPPQQVQEKWHLVDDLSRLLSEPSSGDSLGPESPVSRGSRPRSFCPGFPCPGSPGPRPRRPGPSLEDPAGLRGVSVPAHRFRFPSSSEL